MSQKSQAFLVGSFLTLLMASIGNCQFGQSIPRPAQEISPTKFSQSKAAESLIRRPAFRRSKTKNVPLEQPQILLPIRAIEIPTPESAIEDENASMILQPPKLPMPSVSGGKFASGQFDETPSLSISTQGFASDRIPMPKEPIEELTQQPDSTVQPISVIVDPIAHEEVKVEVKQEVKKSHSVNKPPQPIARAVKLPRIKSIPLPPVPVMPEPKEELKPQVVPPPPTILAPPLPKVPETSMAIPRKQDVPQERIAKKIRQVCGNQVTEVRVVPQPNGNLFIQVDVPSRWELRRVEQMLNHLPELNTPQTRVSVRALR